MKRIALIFAVLLISTNATAADRLACAVSGIVKACPAGATLASGQKIAVGAVPTAVSAANIADGSVSNAEFQRLDGVAAELATISAAQILTNKTINCANNTCTVRLGSDVTGTLIVANGGTGAASLTTHGPLLGNGTGLISAAAAGTAGYVFTSAGAGSDGAYAAPVTATNAQALLSSSPAAISGANGSWNDVGLTTTLPGAGIYRVYANVRSVLNVTTTANAAIELRYYDVTNTAAITNSERMGAFATTTGLFYQAQTPMEMIVPTSAAMVIRVEAASFTGTLYSTRAIYSDSDGRSVIGYEKIGPN